MTACESGCACECGGAAACGESKCLNAGTRYCCSSHNLLCASESTSHSGVNGQCVCTSDINSLFKPNQNKRRKRKQKQTRNKIPKHKTHTHGHSTNLKEFERYELREAIERELFGGDDVCDCGREELHHGTACTTQNRDLRSRPKQHGFHILFCGDDTEQCKLRCEGQHNTFRFGETKPAIQSVKFVKHWRKQITAREKRHKCWTQKNEMHVEWHNHVKVSPHQIMVTIAKLRENKARSTRIKCTPTTITKTTDRTEFRDGEKQTNKPQQQRLREAPNATTPTEMQHIPRLLTL